MTTIYLVRHAQPRLQRCSYRTGNAPLTKQGREDSKKMASFLHHEPIDVIVSSPYPRAKETIRAACRTAESADSFGRRFQRTQDRVLGGGF